MKKHFITVKISFLTFLRHCIKQYPSIRFCAVSMADQAVSAFLSKDRLQKNSQKILLSKEKKAAAQEHQVRSEADTRCSLDLDEQDELYQAAKSKGISGQKNECPQLSKTASVFIQSSSKGMIVAAFCSRRILDDRYLMVGRK